VLAPVFADPATVKVMHGADSDIGWLQRDFGIYVANMFDTGQAARVLGLPSHGLAHLLESRCGFKVQGVQLHGFGGVFWDFFFLLLLLLVVVVVVQVWIID
jgi:hypothetical protein